MNRNTFERYIQELCEDLALKHNSYSHKQKHACVITYNNAVISTGINVNLKNDFIDLYNPLKCIHAESLAIMRAIPKHYNILHKSELWVCRKGKQNCYSKPCPMCQKILSTFHIPVIHYTDDKGNWITEFIK
jgi:cytidine deaminase